MTSTLNFAVVAVVVLVVVVVGIQARYLFACNAFFFVPKKDVQKSDLRTTMCSMKKRASDILP